MSKYTALNMDVYHGANSLAGGLRICEIDPRAAEPDIYDNSARGSTVRTEQEGLPGAIRTRITT